MTWSGRIGGIERSLSTLVLTAAERGGRRQRVCFMDGRGPIGDLLVAAGLAVRLGARGRPGPRSLVALAATLRRERPAAVHLHTHSLAVHATALASLPGATRVYTEHSPRALRPDRKLAVLYRLLRLTTGRLVAPAEAMAETIERRGVDRERIVVVPHPLTIAPRAVAEEAARRRHRRGCRAAEPQKRVDLLIDTVAELSRRDLACRALVVGDGSERPALEAAMPSRGTRRARALRRRAGGRGAVARPDGRVPDDLRVRAVRAHRAEAMARGVPVVAMPCPGGLAELVGAGGLLLPDRSPARAADAVQSLLESPGRARPAARRGARSGSPAPAADGRPRARAALRGAASGLSPSRRPGSRGLRIGPHERTRPAGTARSAITLCRTWRKNPALAARMPPRRRSRR